MRKSAAVLSITFFVVLTLGTGLCRAQENAAKPAEAARAPQAYHLDFSLNELEDGKKINTRQYSMNVLALQSGPRLPIGYEKDLKIGTRVPVEIDQGKTEYLDIGTSIRCQIFADDSGLISLDARADMSSLVSKSEKDQYIPASRNPMLRQLQIQSSETVTLGKLTSLGTVDDPDSKRQFQLEVTVTKLR
jgi:hypothetical protein